MKFANLAVGSAIASSLIFSSVVDHVEGRIGGPSPSSFKTTSRRLNDENVSSMSTSEYLDALTASANGVTTDPAGPTSITINFPPGVYDPTQPQDTSGISEACILAMKNATVAGISSQVLGCRIWFSAGIATPPYALGTLTNDYNYLQYGQQVGGSTQSGYSSDQVNEIFVDYAHAFMIDAGCYVMQTGQDYQSGHQEFYTSSSDYQTTVQNSQSVSMDLDATYAAVSVTASYNEQSVNIQETEKIEKKAYGQTTYYASIGTITNTCLNEQGLFNRTILDNNLINSAVISQWNEIQTAQDASALASSSAFQDVVTGGLMMPYSYKYGSSVYYSLESKYSATDSSTESDMSDTIQAGLSVDFGEGSGTVSDQILSQVNTTSSEKNVQQSTTVSLYAFGTNVTTDCFLSNNCATEVKLDAESQQGNWNNLALPYSHYTFLSLDRIVEWQTGESLGQVFEDALDSYYEYYECSNPGSEDVYIFNPSTSTYWYIEEGGVGALKFSTDKDQCSVFTIKKASIPGEYKIYNSCSNDPEYSLNYSDGDQTVRINVEEVDEAQWSWLITQSPYGEGSEYVGFQTTPNSGLPYAGWWITYEPSQYVGRQGEVGHPGDFNDHMLFEIQPYNEYQAYAANGTVKSSANCATLAWPNSQLCQSSVSFSRDGSPCS